LFEIGGIWGFRIVDLGFRIWYLGKKWDWWVRRENEIKNEKWDWVLFKSEIQKA
jgi:hypothetical protein